MAAAALRASGRRRLYMQNTAAAFHDDAAAVMAVVCLSARPGTTAGAKTVTVNVIHSDKSGKPFTYQTDAEYLVAVPLAEGLIAGGRRAKMNICREGKEDLP